MSRHARRSGGHQDEPVARPEHTDHGAADDFAGPTQDPGYPDAYAAGPYPDQDEWTGRAQQGQPYPAEATQIFQPPADVPPRPGSAPWERNADDGAYEAYQPQAHAAEPGDVFGDQPFASGASSARENYLTGDYTVLEHSARDGSGADWDPHALTPPGPGDELREQTGPESVDEWGAGEQDRTTRRGGSRRSGGRRPRPEPVEVNDVRVVLVGTGAWLAAFLVLLPFRNSLRAHGHGLWMWICLTGAGLGLIGLYYVHRRREALAAAEHLDEDVDEHVDEHLDEHLDEAWQPGERSAPGAGPRTGGGAGPGEHDHDPAGGMEFTGGPQPFHPGPQPESGDWPEQG